MVTNPLASIIIARPDPAAEMSMSEEPNLDAYLNRINYAGSIAPTIETLNAVHLLHPSAIPFENLDPLMELPVRLQLSDIEQKLVIERRGGYCFEHNLLLKAVLEDMDFSVTPIAAGVLLGLEDGVEPDLNHMALIVDVGGTPYLVDAGFGGQVMTAPLRLKPDLEQSTPHERYRLTGGAPLWRLETEIAGEWRPLYQFTTAATSFEDFLVMNDLALGRFRDTLRVARVDGNRRLALRDNRFNIHENGETETREIATISEMREVLSGPFNIQLPASDRLDAALEKAFRPRTTG
jgi:N-hydroxyarylamine O-acetyltransferase